MSSSDVTEIRDVLNPESSEQTESKPDYLQAILDYQAFMKKEGLSPVRIEGRGLVLRQISKTVDLYDGEAVKQWIANSTMKGSTKKLWVVPTYHVFAKWKRFQLVEKGFSPKKGIFITETKLQTELELQDS